MSFIRYHAEQIMISTLTRYCLKEATPSLILRPAIPPAVSIFWGLEHATYAINAGERSVADSPDAIINIIEACR